MQPQRVHQTIHYEGSAGHISRVFQNGKGKIEEHHHRNKNQYTSHTCDNAIHKETLQPIASQAKQAQDAHDPVGEGTANHPVNPIEIRSWDIGG